MFDVDMDDSLDSTINVKPRITPDGRWYTMQSLAGIDDCKNGRYPIHLQPSIRQCHQGDVLCQRLVRLFLVPNLEGLSSLCFFHHSIQHLRLCLEVCPEVPSSSVTLDHLNSAIGYRFHLLKSFLVLAAGIFDLPIQTSAQASF
jgi:hypothetical protein